MSSDSRFGLRARVFDRFARGVSPEVAEIIRRCAADPEILDLVPENPSWDAPHRLTAAVEWLSDKGWIGNYRSEADPWSAFRTAALSHADHVRNFVRDQPVQTNEVQRCFALLPVFLAVARETGRPLDLIELGASAGLNLLWDHYHYGYRAGRWGSRATLLLSGEERRTVPPELLGTEVRVVRRRGIDIKPLDVRRDDDVRLLRVFSAPHRRSRLLQAVAIARDHPPEIIRGDYLQLLPRLLEERTEDALTVVFQTLSTVYLTDSQRAHLREIVDAAGTAGRLAYIGTPTPEEHGERRGDYPIELVVWPGGSRSIVARMDNHGEWLDWIGTLG